MNESGKSNILEALSLREKYFSSEVIDYLSIRRQNATNNEKITIEYIYNFSDDDFRVGSCSYLDYVLSKQEKKIL